MCFNLEQFNCLRINKGGVRSEKYNIDKKSLCQCRSDLHSNTITVRCARNECYHRNRNKYKSDSRT